MAPQLAEGVDLANGKEQGRQLTIGTVCASDLDPRSIWRRCRQLLALAAKDENLRIGSVARKVVHECRLVYA